MPLTFEVAMPAHRAEIEALLARSYPALLAPAYPEQILAAAMPMLLSPRPELLSSGTYFIVRDEAGVAVGAGGWTAGAPGSGILTPGRAHVRHVVTDPGRVRSGIGRALVEYLKAGARAAGASEIESLSTLNAVPFYQACGFVPLETLAVPMGPGVMFPSVRMLARL